MVHHHLTLAALTTAAFSWGPLGAVEVAAQEESERSTAPFGVLVHGTVVDHGNGQPLAGATVSLGAGPSGAPGRGTRVTDDEGVFRFEDVPVGTYRLTASVLGYTDMTDTLQVPEQAELELRLPLSTEPIGLAPVVVTARRSTAFVPGYERRRELGGSGFLITREEIRQKNPRLISELLHRVPGGMVVPTPPYGYTLLLRGQCRPGIWLDGVEATGATSIDQLITPQNIEAIEVYQGFELPVEFGVNPCGGILIWTRHGSPASDDGEGAHHGAWSRMAQVLVVVTLLVWVLR